MMSKRRRTSSEIDSESDEDLGLYPNNTPAVRKRKKLDPVRLFIIIIVIIISIFVD